MDAYFDKQEHKDALKAELKRWKGTRFRYNMAGKASPLIGADCISFPIALYKNIGLIPADYQTPPYISVRSGKHELYKIYSGMDSMQGLYKIWESEKTGFVKENFMFGDLLVCSSGLAVHHCIVITENGYGIHCWPDQGVAKIYLGLVKVTKFARRVYRWYE